MVPGDSLVRQAWQHHEQEPVEGEEEGEALAEGTDLGGLGGLGLPQIQSNEFTFFRNSIKINLILQLEQGGGY